MVRRVAGAIRSFEVVPDTRRGVTFWCVHPRNRYGPADRLAEFAQAYRGDAEADCDARNARAAIEALREPSDAMAEAGFQETGDPCWPENVKRAWRAMIDAALSEATSPQ